MADTAPMIDVASCGCCGSPHSDPAGAVQGVGLRRCRSCNTLRFAAVSPPEAIYDDGYHDGSAPFGWDWTDPSTAAYERVLNDRRVTWLERHAGKGSIVDVGGGLGYFAAAAQRRGWQAALLEPVPQAARFAEQTFGLDVINAGIDALGPSGRTFDVVALSHVLEHVPDALGALQSVRPAIAAGGWLLIEVPNHGSLSRRFEGDRWLGWQAGQHIHVFNRRTLRGLLARAGYEVVHGGSFVPSWSGLLPDANAHFLGLERVLHQAVIWRRRQRTGAGAGNGSTSEGASSLSATRPSVPATELRGVRRIVLGTGFSVLARMEERVGVGTNLRVLARPCR